MNRTSFVKDVLMPPMGLFLFDVDFDNYFIVLKHGQTPDKHYLTPEDAKADGAVTENIGRFMNACIQFFIIALALFWVVRLASNMQRKKEEVKVRTTKECPECCSEINIQAKKCPYCTVDFHMS